MLGTGNALVTECYNTCFILDDNGQYFMVDGGGNAVLSQIKHAGYDWMDMRHIFVTHKHVVHGKGLSCPRKSRRASRFCTCFRGLSCGSKGTAEQV